MPMLVEGNDNVSKKNKIQKYVNNFTFSKLNLDKVNSMEINNALMQMTKSTNSALDILAHVKSLQSIPVTCFENNSLNELEKMTRNENNPDPKSKMKILK